ncbi:MAG: hypothetical protein J5998_02740 [Clostridia bacterium]|nr:hypothetical protein [Clostridia bacterium]
MKTRQFLITVEEGKRLVSRAVAAMDAVQQAAKAHTLAIIAGTTNGYLAEEMLAQFGQMGDFTRVGFRRGANVGPGGKPETGPFANTDVIIREGVWLRGKTIFDIASELGQGDVIVKGANAVQADRKAAGVQIGHPQFGTIAPILEAVMGRRARLVIPVGLEKRVIGEIVELAALVNAPDSSGPRLQPVVGDIMTELEALEALTGARAALIAAGGIAGAEGSGTYALTGSEEQLQAAESLLRGIRTAQ